ncbi:hypothetical protein LC613_26385 [Nostoc sphaeroides CHAB 2801]|uniref:hypothetical protein n=1 Tax=Nostoc sphaeroides TaxID=446679 RepID=UPI0015F326E9|nr:hypothetical protein [Nostoc sphaeroides]MCC5631294.1 hypothetical protein [Nostoc sphaeroides CHAB 2801]
MKKLPTNSSVRMAGLRIPRQPQAIARIFTIVNKVKIYIIKINGTIRIWQKGSYAHT